MFDILKLLKQLLKGDVKFDLDSGTISYRNSRIVAIPALIFYHLFNELEKYLGDASLIIMEQLGEAAGRATREVAQWASAEQVLKELGQFAKVGGFGIVEVKGDELFKNLPIEPSDPVLLRYIVGYLRGLCLEVKELGTEDGALYVKIKPVC